eukprot:TRINITY_DN37_c0_g1_i1.p1 TRINITY_DN37_c0_g1~~TRINITY_DN37_c0_g1_i1.p1  ORF type:complete len:581 (-),score=74.44 TRINITY_DN37_c0_g1_i1:316-2058(-)
MDSPEAKKVIQSEKTTALNQQQSVFCHNELPPTTTLDSSAYPNPNFPLIISSIYNKLNHTTTSGISSVPGSQRTSLIDATSPICLDNDRGNNRSKHLFSSAMGAVVSTLAVQPLEVLRTRLQVMRIPRDELKSSNKQRGIAESLVRISRAEGIRGLYRGFYPSLFSAVPSVSIYFTLYAELKQLMRVPTGNYGYDVGIQSVCAWTASFTTAAITSPLWVIKTRIQALPTNINDGSSHPSVPPHSPVNGPGAGSNPKIVKAPYGILSFSTPNNITPSVQPLNNNYMGYYYNCLNGKSIFKDAKLNQCCGVWTASPLSPFGAVSHLSSPNKTPEQTPVKANATVVNPPKASATNPMGFNEMKAGVSPNQSGYNNNNNVHHQNIATNEVRGGLRSSFKSACSSFFKSTKRFFTTATATKDLSHAASARVQSSSGGALHCLREITRKEGVRGLYRGLSASLFTSTQAMVQFPLYETLKRVIYDQTAHKELSFLSASALSASIACTVSYPSEVVRSRMQIQGSHSSMPKRYNSVLGAFKTIWKEEGFRGMYRGLGTSLLRLTPAHAVSFTVYECVLRALGDKKGI